MMLKEGDNIPEFELKDGEGNTITSDDLKGKRTVLYFYPEDMTTGCTQEACDFRDNYDELQAEDIQILGISPDDEESHQEFSSKYNLPFPLLADVKGEVSKKFGVWITKSGNKEAAGIIRTTFVIDEEGSIEKVFEKVNPENHIEEILDYLERIE